MRRKNIGDYLLLTLFIVGSVGALCASISFIASQNYLPYFMGGRYVLVMSAIALAVLFLSKSAHKLLQNHKKVKTIIFIVLYILFLGAAVFLRCMVIRKISIEPPKDSLENLTGKQSSVTMLYSRKNAVSPCSSSGRRSRFSARQCRTLCTPTSFAA